MLALCEAKKLHKMAGLAGVYGLGAGAHLLGGLGLLHGLYSYGHHHHGHYGHHHHEHHVPYAVPVPVPVQSVSRHTDGPGAVLPHAGAGRG